MRAEGFEWLITDDHENSVFAWARHSGAAHTPIVVSVSNFTPVARDGYTLPLPKSGNWREVLNTDAEAYTGAPGAATSGGVMAGQTPSHGKPASAKVNTSAARHGSTSFLNTKNKNVRGERSVAMKKTAPLARDAMAYVLAGGRGSRLMEFTDKRAKPAVPFGGKSRIIDFALSNAVNSGIRRIGVATQYKATA